MECNETFKFCMEKNGFVATHVLGHMMYGYILLVPMKQRVLNNQSKERNIRFIGSYIYLVHWCQQCVIVHHVSKCMSCHKATVVITWSANCFHDCIYITIILLLWDLCTMYVVDLLWPLMLCFLLSLLSTLWFIGTSNL